jgi:hypothetical protein
MASTWCKSGILHVSAYLVLLEQNINSAHAKVAENSLNSAGVGSPLLCGLFFDTNDHSDRVFSGGLAHAISPTAKRNQFH